MASYIHWITPSMAANTSTWTAEAYDPDGTLLIAGTGETEANISEGYKVTVTYDLSGISRAGYVWLFLYDDSSTKQVAHAARVPVDASGNIVDENWVPAQGAAPEKPTVEEAIMWLYKTNIYKLDSDGATQNYYDFAGTTIDHKRTLNTDGSTSTSGIIVSGP